MCVYTFKALQYRYPCLPHRHHMHAKNDARTKTFLPFAYTASPGIIQPRKQRKSALRHRPVSVSPGSWRGARVALVPFVRLQSLHILETIRPIILTTDGLCLSSALYSPHQRDPCGHKDMLSTDGCTSSRNAAHTHNITKKHDFKT